MRLMNNILFTLLILLLIGCNDSSFENKNYRDSIDEIEEVKIVYEFITDSFDSILDTISIEQFKLNEKDEKVFSTTKLFRNSGNLEKTEYYRNNKLIYSKTESSDMGILSIFEFLDENETKAISVEYRNNIVYDTIFLNYEYKYIDGLLNIMNVYGILDDDFQSKSTVEYNNEEEPIKEIALLNSDTLSIIFYEYNGEHLITRKVIKDYKYKTKTILKYDQNGDILFEEQFVTDENSQIKIGQSSYKTDSEGKLTKKIQTDLLSGEKKYFKLVYTKD